MDILGQSSLLVALTSFSLGFSVVARNVRNTLFLSYAAMTSVLSVWALCFYLDQMWQGAGFYTLHLFFHLLLSPFILVFIRLMVRNSEGVSQKLFILSLLFSFFLSMSLVFGCERYPGVVQVIYFTPTLVLLQLLQLMWNAQENRRNFIPIFQEGSARRNVMFWGAILVFASCLMDHVSFVGHVYPAFGNLILSVYLFFLSQAITQQRLLNIHALFSRFIVLIVVALTLTAVYFLLVGWIENSPSLFLLNSFIASFVILMLLDPLRTLTHSFTQRLLTQKHRSLEQTLIQAQSKLTSMVELGTLFQSIVSTAEHVLQPEAGAFFILTISGTKFRRVKLMGPEGGVALREVIAHHPLVEFCRGLVNRGQFPILLDQMIENERDRSASRTQREKLSQVIFGLKSLGSNLFIPFVTQGKILGFLALKVSSPPEPWRGNWEILPILYPYFQQAAQAMQNMEIYTRQREKERLAALGEMAAGLAHEIRNPLGAIKGAAQYLDPSANPNESKFLKVIIEEVDRLNRVVTQFLDYSKPPTTDLKKVDLARLAEESLLLLQAAMDKEIQVEFSSSPSFAFVSGSSEHLRQVLINLIQNAQSALKESVGLRQIRVSVTTDQDNQEVVCSVEDNGKGIKKEHLDKIFIPFFTTSPSGTGLGLPISQKIIEAHRGRIEVVSEESRFTRCSIILPLAKEGNA